jgi:hypothetical protein
VNPFRLFGLRNTPASTRRPASYIDAWQNQVVQLLRQDAFQRAAGTTPVSSVNLAPPPPPPAPPQDPSLPRAGDPSTWNDNNAPYGITLAGYSPQNHRDITPAELNSTDPANVSKNAKYLVYNYFLENKTQPTQTWAPDAAAALNARYNTNIFHAIDGETLGYGDEYVHSAPNGYGMPRGTYNPDATGELFWGSTSG